MWTNRSWSRLLAFTLALAFAFAFATPRHLHLEAEDRKGAVEVVVPRHKKSALKHLGQNKGLSLQRKLRDVPKHGLFTCALSAQIVNHI
jgi:hypothetical protein